MAHGKIDADYIDDLISGWSSTLVFIKSSNAKLMYIMLYQFFLYVKLNKTGSQMLCSCAWAR